MSCRPRSACSASPGHVNGPVQVSSIPLACLFKSMPKIDIIRAHTILCHLYRYFERSAKKPGQIRFNAPTSPDLFAWGRSSHLLTSSNMDSESVSPIEAHTIIPGKTKKKRIRNWTAEDRALHREFEKSRREAFSESLTVGGSDLHCPEIGRLTYSRN